MKTTVILIAAATAVAFAGAALAQAPAPAPGGARPAVAAENPQRAGLLWKANAIWLVASPENTWAGLPSSPFLPSMLSLAPGP